MVAETAGALPAGPDLDGLPLPQPDAHDAAGRSPLREAPQHAGNFDELGHLKLDRRSAEMLVQVLTEREEKDSVATASNRSFGGWTKTFTDPRPCAAIVHRLSFNGTIIQTGTESCRFAQTKARQQAKKIATRPCHHPSSLHRCR